MDGTHTKYYHTVTAASTNRSPMTKVMDIFRNRTSHTNQPTKVSKYKVFVSEIHVILFTIHNYFEINGDSLVPIKIIEFWSYFYISPSNFDNESCYKQSEMILV